MTFPPLSDADKEDIETMLAELPQAPEVEASGSAIHRLLLAQVHTNMLLAYACVLLRRIEDHEP